MSLEFRLACFGNAGLVEDKPGPSTLRPGSGQAGLGTSGVEAAAGAKAEKFDPEFAVRFLRWREEKRKGGGRRGRVPAPPSMEQVTESIIRKVEAIKRHRGRDDGDSEAGE